MSTSSKRSIDRTIERCRPEDVTPVELEAAAIESTAPAYLRELKSELHDEGLSPTGLSIDASFEDNCSLLTQQEADRIRAYVRAGSFLGVGSIRVTVDTVASPEKVRPALEACFERARRNGVSLDINSPVSLER